MNAIVLVLGLATVFGQRRGLLSDGLLRFEALSALLTQGRLDAGKYSLIGPIFSTPLFYLGKLIHTPDWGCVSYNFVVFCLGLWGWWRGLRAWLTDEEWFAFALLVTMGSMFPNHLQGFYGETFTAVLVSVGLLWVTAGRAGGWGLAIVGAANTPATLVGLGLSTLAAACRERRWRWLGVPVLAAALVLAENAIRRGSIFSSGYEGPAEHGVTTLMPFSGLPGFSYPFLLGLLSILFSFGKGLIFYCPGLFAPSVIDAGREPHLKWLERRWLLFVAGLILVYSKWWAWYGGWFWGPRFFLFASLPASLRLALAYRRVQTPGKLAACLLLMAWSFWIGVNGLVFGSGDLEQCLANDGSLEHLCWYVPEFSPLFRPFVIPRALHVDHYLTLAVFALAYVYLSADGWRRLARLARRPLVRPFVRKT